MKAASKAVLGLFFAVVVLLGILQAASADFPQQDTPLFPLQQVSGSVLEDASVGVSAADAAAINQGSEILTYVIAQYPQNLPFKIGRNTGVVTVSGDLDYETKQLYQFYVQATDSSEPSNSNTTLVSVSILDVNDNPPVFAKANYSVFISKSLSPLSSVITVVASDRDALDSGELTYGFLGGSNVGFVFALDVGTGLITLAKSLTSTLSTVYNLRVGVSDRVENLGTADVTITVIGGTTTGSGEQPVFGNSQYNLNVPEDQVREIEITRFQAILVSGASGEITYRLLPHVDASLFQLTQGGVLMVSEPLDYEKNTSHVLTIEAKGPGDLVGTAQVNINVQDVNDNAPEFTKRQYDVEVSESSNIGQIIAIVTATDGDRAESWNGQLIFTLRDHQDKFRMVTDGRFGVISLAQHIDAETARDNEQNSLEVLIQVRDPDFFDFTTVSVTVFDVNDNNPIFDPSNATISVNDSVPTNTVLYTVSARDIDAAAREIRYRLKDTVSNLFSVDALTGNVSLTSALSFESAREHSVTIIATDNGSPPRSSQFLLKIMVTKATQVPPIFSPSSYSVSIAENSELDRPVALLLATDPDGSIASYQIDSASVPGAFRVTSTGLLLTSIALDRESTPIYTMLVSTVDNTGMASSNSADITITITDRNDMRPEFSPSDFSASIMENAQEGSPVLTLNATDADAGINAVTEFGFVDPLTSLQFSLDSSSGDVTLAAPLPRNSSPTLVFYVFARDGGTPQRQSIAKATVTIVDVNDAPRFHSSSYAVLVSESTPAGSSLLQLNATDGDRPPLNGFILTIRTQSTAGLCNISNDGTLTLNSRLDFETGVQHTVTVRASDSTVLSLFSEAAVTINVANANDNTPLFAQAQYTVRLLENATTRSPVVRLQAADNDAVATINSYSLASTADAGSFSVSSDGVISTEAPLDYETQKVFVLELLAQDDGQPRLTGQTTVIVQLEDVNDNVPFFSMLNISVTLPLLVQPGYSVLRLKATDRDAGANGEVTFSSQDNLGPFRIEGSSINLVAEVSTPQMSYIFTILATDSGLIPLTSNPGLTVTVNLQPMTPSRDVVTVQSIYNISIPEDSSSRDVLLKITASSSANESLVYYILPPSMLEVFEIGNLSGDIRLVGGASLRYEQRSSYAFVVRAQSRLLANAHATVLIDIHNANSFRPIFNPETYTAKIEYTAPNSSAIIQVFASDMDDMDPYQIRYGLVSGNEDGLFTVSAQGSINVARSLRDFVGTTHVLVISAQDHVQPFLLANKSAEVDISVVNVLPPDVSFTQVEYRVNVMENEIDAGIVTLEILAVESGGETDAKFSIVAGQPDGKAFQVDEKSGVISNRFPLNREAKDVYHFDVVVSLGNKIRDTARVVIDVQDKNDNLPRFLTRDQTLLILENVPLGFSLLHIRAEDADEHSNANFTFDIFSGDDQRNFEITPRSNILTVAKPLDFETVSLYSLNISVTDNGSPPQSASTFLSVTVKIRNFNEFDPVFGSTIYTKSVVESQVTQASILQISATDLDSFGRIRYRLTDSVIQSTFSIEGSTGIIRNVVPLDYETSARFSFLVEAFDNALDQSQLTRFGNTLVSILITDANDNFPIPEMLQEAAAVQESSPVGAVVLQLRATDQDSGSNGQVEFNIVAGNTGGVFRMESGLLKVNQTLSFSTQPNYQLKVEVSDRGNPKLTSPDLISVAVSVIRDDEPNVQVQQNAFGVNVVEGQLPDLPIFQIKSAVGSPSRILFYKVLDAFWSSRITINSSTGQVFLSTPLDYDQERRSKLRPMCILVTSTPVNDGKGALVTANINVTDINNNPPQFSNSFQNVSVWEDADITTVVGQVLAEDGDAGENGRISYTILEGNNTVVVDDLGILRLIRSIDHETEKQIIIRVIALDHGTPPLASLVTATMVLTVSNVIDTAPYFSMNGYSDTVAVETSPGASVLEVSAADPEHRPEDLRYKISSSYQPDKVRIDSRTGVISTIGNLSITEGKVIVLCVSAFYDGFESLSSTTWVHLLLKDVNHRPQWIKSRYHAFVLENTVPNVPLARVRAEDNDENTDGQLSYRMVNVSGANPSAFIVTPNGDLKLAGPLDYENGDHYVVTIAAVDGGVPPLETTGPAEVHVTVRNENDNLPSFESVSYEATMNETGGIIASVLTVRARPMEGFGNIVYSLVKGMAAIPFSIGNLSGVVSSTAPLDFEERQHYRFCVSATDEGGQGNTAVTTVVIHVGDLNDNAPKWQRGDYFNIISENVKVPVIVARLSATDADNGQNAQLRYTIVTGDRNVFEVTNNGDVILNVSPDYETKQSFQLKIEATDNGTPALTSPLATVDIAVVNANDNNPVFIASAYDVTFEEGPDVDLLLLTVNATDLDATISQEEDANVTDVATTTTISYDIPDPVMRAIFRITGTGEIRNIIPLDFESRQEYVFCVRAWDSLESDPQRRSALASVNITVTDVNDNSPIVQQVEATVTVSEDVVTGSVVTLLSATDADSGLNGMLTYEIDPSTDVKDRFEVSSQGYLLIKHSLDYESNPLYNLEIFVSDQGIPKRRADDKISVTITVNNTDDESPAFQGQRPYIVAKRERVQEFVTLLTIQAVDPDGFNGIRYSIINPFAANLLSLDATTGELKSRRLLDSADYQEITFCVEAMEMAGSGRRSIADVMVIIRPVNRPPVVVDKSYNGSVREDAVTGTFVVQLFASDADKGQDGAVTYTIMSGNDNRMFNVTSVGGLVVANKLDYETKPSYNLLIRVSDAATPPLSAIDDITVVITIENANDAQPVFTQAIYKRTLSETDKVGVEILQVQASSGEGATVVFRISDAGAQGMFHLNRTTGWLTNIAPIDFESTRLVHFCVEASNAASPQVRSVAQIEIEVTDVNDNRPRFTTMRHEIEVAESAAVGTVLLELEAADPDQGKNGMVKFSLVGGSGMGRFTMKRTGSLELITPLDFATQPQYEMIVQVFDEGSPPLFSLNNITIIINVIEVNDHAPVFSKTDFKITVNETSQNITLGISFSISDEDSCGRHEFRIEDADVRSLLTIDPLSGVIKSIAPLDHETRPNIGFLVSATDACRFSRTSAVPVAISILGINDNAPKFKDPSITIFLSEQTPTGEQIVLLAASDADGDVVSYRIKNSTPASPLSLDSNNFIYLERSLNYSLARRYDLVIEATDNGKNPLSSSLELHVNVVSISEAIISFSSPRYNWTVLERVTNAAVGLVSVNSADVAQGLIEYFLPNSSVSQVFHIHKNSGMITNITPLRFSERKVYEFCIRAVKDGQLSSSTWVDASVVITASLDHQPHFLDSVYTFEASEAVANNTVVGIVRATDEDQGLAGTISYSLSGQDHESFSVDSRGQVVVQTTLDDEGDGLSRYSLTVNAVDMAVPPQTANNSAQVTIDVINVNDNDPVFSNSSILGVTVEEDSVPCDNIASLRAIDRDPSDVMGYLIISSESRNRFKVDNITGVLSCVTSLDYEADRFFHLAIEAYDSSERQRTGVLLLDITVTDKNDNAPILQQRSYTFDVHVSTSVNSVFGKVTARDVDTSGEPIIYKLSNHPSFVRINNVSGELFVASGLVPNGSFIMTVTACDGGDNTLESSAKVTVTVYGSSRIAPGTTTNNSSTATTFEIELDIKNSFPLNWSNMSEFWVLLQEYVPEDSDFAALTEMPFLTWFHVNFKGSIDKNYMRKYLAFKFIVPTSTRRRRANDFSTTGILTFVAGNESGCVHWPTVGEACNGPLQPGQAYRIQLYAVGSSRTFSGWSSPIQTTVSSLLLPGRAAKLPINLYFIVGLVSIGMIDVILIGILAALVINKKRPFLSREQIIFSDSTETGLPPSIDDENKANSPGKNYFRARVYSGLYTVRPEATQVTRIDSFKYSQPRADAAYIPDARRETMTITEQEEQQRQFKQTQSSFGVGQKDDKDPIYTLPYRSSEDQGRRKSKKLGARKSAPVYDAVLLNLEDLREMELS